MIVLNIPIRTGSGLNGREHWRAKARRVKHERIATRLAWFAAGRPTITPPCAVRLVRVSPGTRRTDDDNLPGTLKAVRDVVAAIAGVDDGDPRWAWSYGQERGGWGVRVEIEETGAG